jgi:ABC-2 type transport system permease protein
MSTVAMFRRQVVLAQKGFWRSGQWAFFALPIALLLTVGVTAGQRAIPGRPGLRSIDLVVPGIVAFCVIAAAYGDLAITLAVQRDQGVLKRLRATPMPRWAFIAGQVGSSLLIGALLVAVVIPLGVVLYGVGVPAAHLLGLAIALGVGATCFCVLGIALSADIPSAEAATAVTSASYLPLAIVSGIFYPLALLGLPDWFHTVVTAFPIARLAHALQHAFDARSSGLGVSTSDLLVMGAWAVGGVLLDFRFFRWSSDK